MAEKIEVGALTHRAVMASPSPSTFSKALPTPNRLNLAIQKRAFRVDLVRTHMSIASSLPVRASVSTEELPTSSATYKGVENLVIIGSGPAGYTAAIYSARANLKPVVFEGYQIGGSPGGQLMTTTEVDNFPGFPDGISGPDLMDGMRRQAERWGAQLYQEDVEYIDVKSNPFTIRSSEREVKCHSVIVATGATAKRLRLPREDEFWSRGISACAICDGALPLFKGQVLAVVGGGDTATEEALYLTKYARHVHLLVRRDQLRASKAMQDRVVNNPNVTLHFNTEPVDVVGNTKGQMTGILVKKADTGEESVLEAKGLFYGIGHTPNSQLLEGQIELDGAGYVLVKEGTAKTSVEGVFAAGDVQDHEWRQAITAAGSGCVAALSVERYLVSNNMIVEFHQVNARKFDISSDMFWRDGHPFQVIGGDLHYFRVLPEYWKDRLLRAKALGLNTIQTYVPWNLHEPKPGEWIFEGIADIESFLKLCQELGFLVMLRAGPYICGEWDLGGFPAWLLAIEPALRLRSSDTAFLQLVDIWWSVLLPKIAPLLYNNGGPIVMVQIENEYGSYGDDKSYLRYLVTLARTHLGGDVILYTTDGGSKETLEKGTIHGSDVFSAVDFTTGDNPWPIFELQKEFNAPGKSPPLSAEFYTGWLTHWGEKLAKTDANSVASALETILSRNGSAVLYMVHGGTNFGFFNGANTGRDDSDYKPDLTSYDYDAPIKESGDVENSKFRALRGVIQRYSSVSLPPIPSNNGRRGYGHIKVRKFASLFDVLDATHMIKAENPLPMESAGQMFGFLMYVAECPVKENGSILSIAKIHDRAQVFVSCPSNKDGKNPKYVGTIERWSNRALGLPYMECASNISLFVLVENMGRVNYGPYLHDLKGVLSAVFLDRDILYGWKMFPIPLDNLNRLLKVNHIVQVEDHRTPKALQKKIKYQSKMTSIEPGFYEGRLTIDTLNGVKDTYLSLSGWSKGIAFVNGFNIGRFWPSHGPQCNLYVPGPLLQRGENVVVILEIEAPNPQLVVTSVDQPDYTCGSKVHHL